MSGILGFVAMFFAASITQAQTLSRSLSWNELAAVAVGQPVAVELKDGSAVRGVPSSVEPAALIVEVTSNAHRTYKKGRASIPRAEIAGLRIGETRSGMSKARIGLLVGLVAGGVGGVALLNRGIGCSGFFCPTSSPYENDAAYIAGGASVLVAAPAAGYFIGRHADRKRSHETRITILPD